MKKYIVKVTGKATENNLYSAGQEFVAYYGKNQKLLGHIGSHAEAAHTTMDLKEYLIKEYGYTRECDAKHSWCYKNQEDRPFWRTTAEIVEVNVD